MVVQGPWPCLLQSEKSVPRMDLHFEGARTGGVRARGQQCTFYLCVFFDNLFVMLADGHGAGNRLELGLHLACSAATAISVTTDRGSR